ENVVRRALLLADGKAEIDADDIVFDQPARLVPEQGNLPEPDHRLSNIVQLSEAKAIMQTLDACRGNRIATARQLGISERTLRYRLAAFREAGLAIAGARR
ncbi:MAG: helix-turn-helix domain-containing protein, partial [Novosphingobium sp.]